MSDTCIGQSCSGTNRMLVRFLYMAIFLVNTLIAWMVRDFGQNAFAHLRYMRYCRGDLICLGSEGVLRISFGCFVFYFIMYMSTVGVTTVNDPRDAWHTGFWPIKSLIWISCLVVPFFIPTSVTKFYGEISRFGGGIFLFVQLLAILNFVYWWNENWASENNTRRWQVYMLTVSVVSSAASIVGLIMMYIYFTPRVSCGVNIFLITWTLILVLLMFGISLHSKVNAGPMIPGLISLYAVFLCWSALVSEPDSEVCNLQPQLTGRGDWITLLSFAFGAFTLVMATLSTGIDPKSLSMATKESSTDTKIPYGYGFFHFIFGLASMYLAMLFLGWNLQHTIEKWTLDFGWASVWLKIINQWLAVSFYVWTLTGSLILQR
ncbi:hypothetical protein SUGI_0195450 [Cryptomeria japonica]|nr:hypothetical protein SUGI_0195450 [Cryptomeria japonica]